MKDELFMVAVLLSVLLPSEAVDPAECMEKFFWCVTTAFPMDKYHKANVECCEKTLTEDSHNNSDSFREIREALSILQVEKAGIFNPLKAIYTETQALSLCIGKKYQDRRQRCFHVVESPCRELIAATYRKDGKDYAEFSNKVAAKAKPPSAAAGCDKFIRDSESAEQELCRQNTKTSLEPMCKVVLEYVASSVASHGNRLFSYPLNSDHLEFKERDNS